MRYTVLLGVWFVCLAMAAWASSADDRQPPRALVAEFVNKAGGRYEPLAEFATDLMKNAFTRRGMYDVIERQEVDRAAAAHSLHTPYRKDDLLLLAKDLGAAYIVTGDLHHVRSRMRDKKLQVEAGLIVRVRDVALDVLVNGAAERGIATGKPDGIKPDALPMKALAAAANQEIRL